MKKKKNKNHYTLTPRGLMLVTCIPITALHLILAHIVYLLWKDLLLLTLTYQFFAGSMGIVFLFVSLLDDTFDFSEFSVLMVQLFPVVVLIKVIVCDVIDWSNFVQKEELPKNDNDEYFMSKNSSLTSLYDWIIKLYDKT